MTRIEKVLVPLDGSDGAEITLTYALALAGATGAELTLASVDESGGESANLYQSYLELLDKRLSETHPNLTGRWQTRLASGKAGDELLRLAGETGADLVVISAHGASGKGAAQLGKTASKILSDITRPVLLIKSAPKAERPLIRRILVPLDGSGIGQAAVEMAAGLAPAFGAEIHLLQVVESVRYMPSIDGLGAYTLPIDDEEIYQEAEAFLGRRADELKEKGQAVVTAVAGGAATEQISRYAEENDIDLIAMSTHGLSGLSKWVFGSVTQKLIQYGTLPVLVVKPEE
ncbi:UspA domain protein [Dehalogenimonas lykanthroporepellens BL-DC-9]|nr:UspA domain protein [Dehalogenimonas lykanthroporepellens BL-DC-9]